MAKAALDDEGLPWMMKALMLVYFLVHFWCICICALIFIRVENGLTELGSILGGVQMNARIKAHLTSTLSGRSESYNNKCEKMHQKISISISISTSTSKRDVPQE